MDIQDIQKRIDNEIDYIIIEKLKDENMIQDYLNSKSVKIKIKNIKKLLKITMPNSIKSERHRFIKEYIKELIPAGTKGVLKGNKFNDYIKHVIIENISSNYEINFEQISPYHKTSEIPDWTIHNPKNKKTIIGMNQLTLWGGGHQTNRASKYVTNNTQNTQNTIFISVVCNHITIKTKKSKVYHLFNSGFSNNILCYPKALTKHIINFLK